jgi:hypothetical protein
MRRIGVLAPNTASKERLCSRRMRGEVKKQNHSRDAFRARVLRPPRHENKALLDSPPATKEGAERRKAHHPMPRAHQTSVATCRLARERAKPGRARLPALRCGTRQHSRNRTGSAPEPRFLGRGWGECFARLGPVQSSELLADRSLCRPSGAPEPPECGLQIRPRVPHSLRFSGLPSGKAPSMSE